MKSPVAKPLLHRKKSGRSDGYASGGALLLVRLRTPAPEANRPIFEPFLAHF